MKDPPGLGSCLQYGIQEAAQSKWHPFQPEVICSLCSLWGVCANPQEILQDHPVPALRLCCLRCFFVVPKALWGKPCSAAWASCRAGAVGSTGAQQWNLFCWEERAWPTKMSCVLRVYQIFAYSYFTYMGWWCSVCSGGLMSPKQVERVHPQETSIFVDTLILWEAVHATHVVEYYEIRCYWKSNQVLFWKRTTQSII